MPTSTHRAFKVIRGGIRPLTTLLPVTLIGAALAGCSISDRPAGPAATPARAATDDRLVTVSEGFRIVHDDWASLGYRWDWSVRPRMSRGARIQTVDAYDDVVIAHDTSNVLSLLEAPTGRTRWSVELAGPLSLFVGNVRDGDRLIASSESEVMILDLINGNLRDRQSYAIVVNTRPVLLGDTLYYGTPRGELLAHSLRHAMKIWGYDTGATISAPAVSIGDDIVGVVSQRGAVLFADADSGRSLGRASIAGGLENAPVADEGRMYVASLDQSVYAFDARTGRRVWRYRTPYPIRVQPTLHDGVLYCSVREEGLIALDAATGRRLWGNPEVEGRVAAVRDGNLVVWTGSGVVLVDPARGDLIARIDTPDAVGLRTDAFVDGTLYAIGRTGVIVRFIPR